MKNDPHTPSLLSVHIGETTDNGVMEWSPRYKLTQRQRHIKNIEISPSHQIRRASSSLISSQSSSSIISSTSSTSSVSSGFGAYDDSDDNTTDGVAKSEDKYDPMISFESLSLTSKEADMLSDIETKSTISRNKNRSMKHIKTQQGKIFPPTPLDLAASFERIEHFELTRRCSSKTQRFRERSDTCVPKSKEVSMVAPSIANHSQRRRPAGRKFMLRKSSQSMPSNDSCTINESSNRFCAKRERGGSDFSMAMESESSSTSPSRLDRRKRRRISRNRAMGAVEFDSILSQLGTTGSF